MDCAITYDGENMYECMACKNCYELFFGSFCQDCRESRFLYDCIGCHDCIMCFGLRNKSYCIKNQQLSKEEYEAEKKKYDLGSYENLGRLKQEYIEFLRNYPLRESNNVNCENCVGDFLRDASNCFMCFNGAGSRDCRYGIPYCNKETGCFDTDGTGAVNCYECNCYQSENVMFSKGVLNSHDVDYSIDIMGASHDLFGCANLKGNNEYCILNKRYSKDEYSALRDRIVAKMKADGEWGEHFPMTTALFTYYDSYSYPPWPIEEGQITYVDKEKGLAEVDLGGAEKSRIHWRPVLEFVRDEASGYVLADDVREYASEQKQQELLNAVLVCDKTGRKYRIQSRELYFYLKHSVAIPRESFHARHTRRMNQLMRCDIHSYNCDKCGKGVQTVYNKDVDGRQVWCGDCYQGVLM